MLSNRDKLTRAGGIFVMVLMGFFLVGGFVEMASGLIAPQQRVARTKEKPVVREEIGRWNHDRPGVESVVTIFRKNNRLFMEDKYRDGSSGRTEIVEEPYSRGMKLKPKKANDFGEYFVVDKRGNLQYWDRDGLFYTAKTMP